MRLLKYFSIASSVVDSIRFRTYRTFTCGSGSGKGSVKESGRGSGKREWKRRG